MPEFSVSPVAAMPALRAAPPHPNALDRKRIERALAERVRYRYVKPEVSLIEDGYLITSPCCSRNIDSNGGVIDIARLTYSRVWGNWSLQYRDHPTQRWVLHSEHASLTQALSPLLADPERCFWP